MLVVVNLAVTKVFAGRNVADIGTRGVTLEVSVMMRNMSNVPEMISVTARGNVGGFVAGQRSEHN
jgi:hypothetical protein